jgi:threonine dehydratase
MRSGVRIVGVEPEGAAKISRSRDAGHPVTLERVSSIADGLLAVRPGDVTFEHVQALVDDVMTVTDDQIKAAVLWLFSEASLVAEPSGAAAVAGALARGSAAGTSVAIISGGNVDPAAYARYITAPGPPSPDTAFGGT